MNSSRSIHQLELKWRRSSGRWFTPWTVHDLTYVLQCLELLQLGVVSRYELIKK